MSTNATLEGIWDAFKRARKDKDVIGMRLCLKEHDLEYDPTKLPQYAPQKQMARRGVMVRSIEYHGIAKEREKMDGGSW